MQSIQNIVKKLQDKYEQILQIQEILKQTTNSTIIQCNNNQIDEWKQEKNNELNKLKRDYIQESNKWENITKQKNVII